MPWYLFIVRQLSGKRKWCPKVQRFTYVPANNIVVRAWAVECIWTAFISHHYCTSLSPFEVPDWTRQPYARLWCVSEDLSQCARSVGASAHVCGGRINMHKLFSGYINHWWWSPCHSPQLLSVPVECHLCWVNWVLQTRGDGVSARVGSEVPAAMTTGHLRVLWCVRKLLLCESVSIIRLCLCLLSCKIYNFRDELKITSPFSY